MSALISVIIPSYNCAPYLPDAIMSVFAQSYPDVEVIVVNDGSTDNTDEVVRPFLERINYIKQGNRGLSSARNIGFYACHGEYVCFLDADDLLLPLKFERQLALLTSQPDLGMVISGYTDVEADGKTIIRNVYKYWDRDALSHLLNHEVFPPHASLIRRSVLEESALFPEDINNAESQEDWQLWFDLALNNVIFSSVPEPLCLYRHRADSISSNALKHLEGARRVVEWLRHHPRSGPYREKIERLDAIVDMERVGRAWQAGQFDLAARELSISLQVHPDFWREPPVVVRLFQNSISLRENARFLETMNILTFERSMAENMLPRLIKDETVLSQVQAVVYLAISDFAYGQNNSGARKRAVRNAYRLSRQVCLSPQGLPSFIRGLVGPKVGAFPGRLQTVMRKR
jgi:glycosyltransferase involved in cell wall biosynthesis